MDWIWLLSYLALGAITGVFAGLLGVGGGGIMVPVLTMMFAAQGFNPEHKVHLALGTSMAAIVPTAIASARAHHLRGGVVWPAVRGLAPGVLLGTFAATFVASFLSGIPLAIFFAVFMSAVALYMMIGKPPHADRILPGPVGLGAVGSGIGGVSALVAIGGGSLTVPFLVWCNVPMARAVGTSAAVGLPIAAAGAAGYIVNGWGLSGLPSHTLGFVVWPAVLAMALMSFITAPLGARLAHRLPVATLKRVFAVVMVLLAVKMLHGVLVG
ncbi:sulfite exporter TauE/SafE family protein [Gilvimarinus polysaccharolyticus]|uniref:sulfite exporter TauE/SafE family protein n=1 Tax=Gilvimarinus polysaccharolyticus TaxID=863921 RepID=UPI00067390B6|nr:sulfite exporter TauE/SafE family protein [Gilvimarinus polysaccharolyticus]